MRGLRFRGLGFRGLGSGVKGLKVEDLKCRAESMGVRLSVREYGRAVYGAGFGDVHIREALSPPVVEVLSVWRYSKNLPPPNINAPTL